MDLRGAATAGRSSSENQAMQHCIDDFFLPWARLARFPFQLDLNTSETTNLHLNLLGPTHFFHPADSLDSAAFKISLAGLVELGHMEVHQHGWAYVIPYWPRKIIEKCRVSDFVLYRPPCAPEACWSKSWQHHWTARTKFAKVCVAIQSAYAFLLQVEHDTLHLHAVKMRLFFNSSSWKVKKNLRWGLPVLRFDQDKWKKSGKLRSSEGRPKKEQAPSLSQTQQVRLMLASPLLFVFDSSVSMNLPPRNP